jgi:dihydropteroate synthase
VAAEVTAFLRQRVEFAITAGIPRERLIIDPGIGFGKTTIHNLEIIRRVSEFRRLGLPVMIGPSRKRFISEILDLRPDDDRLTGALAVVTACVLTGVECLRVHDVAACRQAARMAEAIRCEQ